MSSGKPGSINYQKFPKRNIMRDRKPTTQKKIKKVERRVAKLENQIEWKYHDLKFAITDATTPPFTASLSGVADGDDHDRRIGLEVVAKRLTYSVDIETAPAESATAYRLIIFWDKQSNAGSSYDVSTGVASSTTQIKASAVLDNLLDQDLVVAPFNYITSDRFKILLDKVIVINPFSGAMETSRIIRGSIALSGAKIKYASTEGSSTTMASRNLAVILVASSAVVSTATLNSRFWYQDP